MISGLLEDPATEMFGVNWNGGSIGQAGVGLATGRKEEQGTGAGSQELIEC